ncbi:hypothetical protein ACFYKT_17060 [Cytobacillus sp. FJAT-53684]|uniref:N-acetyltransferase domain-containing protein n=1 Tax=Cytobacillus mangrovibacter TaxID=3299024 RepID=A0ABW6K1K2_9BACI
MESIIRCAQAEDVTRLESFLEEAKLSVEGIQSSIENFLIMENHLGDIKATLGIEPLGKLGLLRSLVMRSETAERDLFILFEQMLMLARDRQLESIYLASNKKNSFEFFRLLGFTEEAASHLPEALLESQHVKHILAVDNSFFLKLSI